MVLLDDGTNTFKGWFDFEVQYIECSIGGNWW